jgi:inhibitor of KinA
MKGAALEPIGDQGVMARFGREEEALAWAAAVRGLAADWLLDVVGAYATVAVYHDRERISLAELMRVLKSLPVDEAAVAGASHVLPCCYELGPGVSADEVARLHAGAEYTVYAIGFCPGFPYMGYLPGPLCGVPRLESPRLRVEPGSVGLTGRQTGIYTEPRPGGWNLVGRTPLTLVDVADGYFPLRTGDRVRFERIDEAEYRRLLGQRL